MGNVSASTFRVDSTENDNDRYHDDEEDDDGNSSYYQDVEEEDDDDDDDDVHGNNHHHDSTNLNHSSELSVCWHCANCQHMVHADCDRCSTCNGRRGAVRRHDSLHGDGMGDSRYNVVAPPRASPKTISPSQRPLQGTTANRSTTYPSSVNTEKYAANTKPETSPPHDLIKEPPQPSLPSEPLSLLSSSQAGRPRNPNATTLDHRSATSSEIPMPSKLNPTTSLLPSLVTMPTAVKVANSKMTPNGHHPVVSSNPSQVVTNAEHASRVESKAAAFASEQSSKVPPPQSKPAQSALPVADNSHVTPTGVSSLDILTATETVFNTCDLKKTTMTLMVESVQTKVGVTFAKEQRDQVIAHVKKLAKEYEMKRQSQPQLSPDRMATSPVNTVTSSSTAATIAVVPSKPATTVITNTALSVVQQNVNTNTFASSSFDKNALPAKKPMPPTTNQRENAPQSSQAKTTTTHAVPPNVPVSAKQSASTTHKPKQTTTATTKVVQAAPTSSILTSSATKIVPLAEAAVKNVHAVVAKTAASTKPVTASQQRQPLPNTSAVAKTTNVPDRHAPVVKPALAADATKATSNTNAATTTTPSTVTNVAAITANSAVPPAAWKGAHAASNGSDSMNVDVALTQNQTAVHDTSIPQPKPSNETKEMSTNKAVPSPVDTAPLSVTPLPNNTAKMASATVAVNNSTASAEAERSVAVVVAPIQTSNGSKREVAHQHSEYANDSSNVVVRTAATTSETASVPAADCRPDELATQDALKENTNLKVVSEAPFIVVIPGGSMLEGKEDDQIVASTVSNEDMPPEIISEEPFIIKIPGVSHASIIEAKSAQRTAGVKRKADSSSSGEENRPLQQSGSIAGKRSHKKRKAASLSGTAVVRPPSSKRRHTIQQNRAESSSSRRGGRRTRYECDWCDCAGFTRDGEMWFLRLVDERDMDEKVLPMVADVPVKFLCLSCVPRRGSSVASPDSILEYPEEIQAAEKYNFYLGTKVDYQIWSGEYKKEQFL